MPIYEYQCTRCQKRTEKLQPVNAEPLRECPSCGGPLERVISPPAIQFKGSGWYVTDYARKSGAPSGNGKAAKEPKESKPEKTSEAKSESKAEAKSNSKKDKD